MDTTSIRVVMMAKGRNVRDWEQPRKLKTQLLSKGQNVRHRENKKVPGVREKA